MERRARSSVRRVDSDVLPAAPTGFHWRRSGAGIELRQTIYEHGKRRQVYRGHIGKARLADWQHEGRFDAALADWLERRLQPADQ